MYPFSCFTLYSRNQHNIVKQLSSNLKKKKKVNPDWKPAWLQHLGNDCHRFCAASGKSRILTNNSTDMAIGHLNIS